MNRIRRVQGARTEGVPSVRAFALSDVHDERGPAVQPARLFTSVVVLRPLFTVADGAQAVGSDAAADQILANRVRAAVAQRQVVLGRADVAGVSFDFDAKRRVGT